MGSVGDVHQWEPVTECGHFFVRLCQHEALQGVGCLCTISSFMHLYVYLRMSEGQRLEVYGQKVLLHERHKEDLDACPGLTRSSA